MCQLLGVGWRKVERDRFLFEVKGCERGTAAPLTLIVMNKKVRVDEVEVTPQETTPLSQSKY